MSAHGLHISLFQSVADLPTHVALPVKTWNPPFCGNIDMRIKRDGTWFYNGTPILRTAMVQLFSRILRKEGDAYFLVTPAEKIGITVEDVPFIAVEMSNTSGVLSFRTNVGDTVITGTDQPLYFQTDDDTFTPYVEVRDGLRARLNRALARDLAILSEVRRHKEQDWFGITTSGIFFPIMPVGSLLDP